MKELMRWNLDDLLKNVDIEYLEKYFKDIEKEVIKFEKTYKGKVKELSSKELKKAFDKIEAIYERLARAGNYVMLLYSSNITKENGILLNKTQMLSTKLSTHLIFFTLEITKAGKKKWNEWLKDKTLKKYHHNIEQTIVRAPYRLKESEEQILLKKSQTSSSAFTRLFANKISKLKVSYHYHKFPFEKALSFLRNNNRDNRRDAANAITTTLKENIDDLIYIFNTVTLDHIVNTEIRKYPDVEESRHLSNEISRTSVDNLIQTVEESYALPISYYKKKKKLLMFDRLYDYDRYAPITNKKKRISFEKAKETVLNSYRAFSEDFYAIAKKFFDNNWIDAGVRANKRGGAFSAGTIPAAHPYVLLNFTGDIRDVFVMAHELGHGIHQYLSREVGLLNMHTPLTTAETASTFGEMLTFDYILEKTPLETQVSLLASKLEDIFSTVFRQTIFTTFERRLYQKRMQKELIVEEMNALWIEENKKMFSNALKLRDEYGFWWAYISHFINTPFYCYAYAYGNLLSLSLYKKYKDMGTDFVKLYKDILSKGGSIKPSKLLKPLVDIEDKDFWKGGIAYIKELLDKFLKLSAKRS